MPRSWSHRLRNWWSRAVRRNRSRPCRFVPSLEFMEDRTLLSPGGLDASFGTGGKVTFSFEAGNPNDDEARAVVIQPDGKILVAGSAQPVAPNYDFAIARLTPSGAPDVTFNATGKVTVGFDLGGALKDRASSLALQRDGKIVVAGSAQTAAGFDFALARLTPLGALDPTFNGGKAVASFGLGGDNDDEATGVALQPDGKIVVVGYAGISSTRKVFAVARFNANGTLDTTFNGTGKTTVVIAGQDDEARGVVIQPDGKIVVAGFAQISGSNNDFAVARLNPNGTLDGSFNGSGKQTVAFDLGGGKNDAARSVALEPDGKIILAGYAERFIPNYDFAVARLTPTGALDPTFNGTGKQTVPFDLGAGNDDEATTVAVQPGGKIVVAGFAQVSASNYNFAIARLTANGSLDPAFNHTGKQIVPFNLGGSTQDEAFGLALQPDGKMVAAGFAQRAANSFEFAVTRLEGANTKYFAVGGAPGRVEVFRPDGTAVTAFAPYGSAYTGGVSVAWGDVNGDGVDDLITGATVGNPHVKVFSGADFLSGRFNPANPDASVLTQWFPYAIQYNVGANVAAGDINGNGYADVVTGATVGNPDVRVYSGKDIAAGTFNPAGASLLAEWFPYAIQYNVGANVAVGDIAGDGFADVVTGATVGNPDVRVYSGRDIATGAFNPTGSLRAQFFAYGINYNVGAFVAVGDVNGDGFADLITGSSIGNPQVKIYSGLSIATGGLTSANPDAALINQFYAYDVGVNLGVSIGAADFGHNGVAEILTGPVHGSLSNYRVVSAYSTGTHPPALPGLDGNTPEMQGGLLVGA